MQTLLEAHLSRNTPYLTTSGASPGIAGILAKYGLIRFGRKLPIARHVLRIDKALRKSYDKERSQQS